MIKHMSEPAARLLKGIEHLALRPYDDQTGKTISAWCKGATIGYGHLIKLTEWPRFKNGITRDEAEALFLQDARGPEALVTTLVKRPLVQHEFDALVILIFNIGEPQFRRSSVLKLINDPSAKTPYSSLDNAWRAFRKSQGKINQGLINRRNCELKIWHQGIYERW